MKMTKQQIEGFMSDPFTSDQAYQAMIVILLQEILSIIKPEQPAEMSMKLEENISVAMASEEIKPAKRTRKKAEKVGE